MFYSSLFLIMFFFFSYSFTLSFITLLGVKWVYEIWVYACVCIHYVYIMVEFTIYALLFLISCKIPQSNRYLPVYEQPELMWHWISFPLSIISDNCCAFFPFLEWLLAMSTLHKKSEAFLSNYFTVSDLSIIVIIIMLNIYLMMTVYYLLYILFIYFLLFIIWTVVLIIIIIVTDI